jgi:hypothetical protein
VYCFLLARIETHVVFFVACKNSKIWVKLDLTLSLAGAAAEDFLAELLWLNNSVSLGSVDVWKF